MHLGLIGYGSIASTLLGLLDDRVKRITVLARAGRATVARTALPGVKAVDDVAELIAAGPDLVIECAGHAAVRDAGVPLLRAGIDVVVVSIGALSDDGLHEALRTAATQGKARMILPAGAVGGVDLLAALSGTGQVKVRYTGTKPPAAWRGTPADHLVDLDALVVPTPIFAGSAREAAQAYPKNANVAATLALAGAGFDATHVMLVADPTASGNTHSYSVRTPAANFEIRIDSQPSAGNAKTSVATIYSVLREIRNFLGPVVI